MPLSLGAGSARSSLGGTSLSSQGAQSHPMESGSGAVGLRDSFTGDTLSGEDMVLEVGELVRQLTGGMGVPAAGGLPPARNSSSASGARLGADTSRLSSMRGSMEGAGTGFNSDMLHMSDAWGSQEFSRASADQVQMWLRGSLSGSLSGQLDGPAPL